MEDKNCILYAVCKEENGSIDSVSENFKIKLPLSIELQKKWLNDLPSLENPEDASFFYFLQKALEDFNYSTVAVSESEMVSDLLLFRSFPRNINPLRVYSSSIYNMFFNCGNLSDAHIFLCLCYINVLNRSEVLGFLLDMEGTKKAMQNYVSTVMDTTVLHEYLENSDESCRMFGVFATHCLFALSKGYIVGILEME